MFHFIPLRHMLWTTKSNTPLPGLKMINYYNPPTGGQKVSEYKSKPGTWAQQAIVNRGRKAGCGHTVTRENGLGLKVMLGRKKWKATSHLEEMFVFLRVWSKACFSFSKFAKQEEESRKRGKQLVSYSYKGVSHHAITPFLFNNCSIFTTFLLLTQ